MTISPAAASTWGLAWRFTEDEFANLGIDFGSRGKRTDDALCALARLFTGEFPAHDGEFFRFSGLRFEPKPVQEPLPVHVGGGSAAAFRRVVRFGQGWHALGRSPNEIRQDLRSLDSLLSAAGRTMDEIHVSVRCGIQFLNEAWKDRQPSDRRTLEGTDDEIVQMLSAYQAAGVGEVVIDPNSRDISYNQRCIDQVRSLWAD